MKTIYHDGGLQCYLDGGYTAVYTVWYEGKNSHWEDVIEFCKNNGHIAAVDEPGCISVSIEHIIDGVPTYIVLVKCP